MQLKLGKLGGVVCQCCRHNQLDKLLWGWQPHHRLIFWLDCAEQLGEPPVVRLLQKPVCFVHHLKIVGLLKS
jgi:hypothetical protein